MQDVYRSCAAIVVFRTAGDNVEVLLLHKPRKKDDWQLPQGGREAKESLEQAAQRELKEEANLTVRVLGRSSTVYQYDFPASYRRFRPDNICGQRIEFIFAVQDNGEGVTVDGDEIDQYVWVKPNAIGRYLRRKQYLHIVEKLVEEGIALLQRSQ